MARRNALIAAFGLSRVGFGIAECLAPARIGKAWIGEPGGGRPTGIIVRAVGARDIALGAGMAEAARRDAATPWLALSVFADLVDLAATAAARDRIPTAGLATTTAVAGTVITAGLALLAFDSRSGDPGRVVDGGPGAGSLPGGV
ncbi:MAG: hypothetical protein KDB62_05560 [Solirubrobacterales bacterium]|nr:hypothetical protein [Solirubrobacterales bacterium]